MPRLQWDRILETCTKRGSYTILVAGAPPLLQCDWGWRAFQVPPLDGADIAAMLAEIVPTPGKALTFAGLLSFDLPYDRSEAGFRVTVFGQPSPIAIVLTRLPPQAPPLPTELDWKPLLPPLSLPQMFSECIKRGWRSMIWAVGCSPAVWSPWGIHALPWPVLDDSRVAELVHEALRGQTPHAQDGYGGFDVRCGPKEVFRVAVFGSPAPTFVVLIRLPRDPWAAKEGPEGGVQPGGAVEEPRDPQ